MNGNTLRDKTRDNCIHKKLEVAPIEDEIKENRWDGLNMWNWGLYVHRLLKSKVIAIHELGLEIWLTKMDVSTEKGMRGFNYEDDP